MTFQCTPALNSTAVVEIEAQQRAAQVADATLRSGFEQIACEWFALAEQVDWLEGHQQTALQEKPK